MSHRLCLAAAALISLAAAPARADDPQVEFRNHTVTPERVEVPAGQKFKLIVKNSDATAEEFESGALKREKVVAGGSTATVLLGPLAPGEYPFVGEYHEDTAHGVIVAR